VSVIAFRLARAAAGNALKSLTIPQRALCWTPVRQGRRARAPQGDPGPEPSGGLSPHPVDGQGGMDARGDGLIRDRRL